MEELKLMADFVTDSPVNSKKTAKTARYDKAIRFLQTRDFVTDAEIAEAFKMKEGSGQFRMFKSRLRKRLMGALLNTIIPSRISTPYNIANINCALDQYCVRFLLMAAGRSLAVSIARQALRRAIAFQLTDYIVFFSRVLRTDASWRSDLVSFAKYDAQCRNALQTLVAEDQVNVFAEELNAVHRMYTVWPTSLVEKGRKYCKKVSELRETYNTFNLNIAYHRLHGQQRYIEQDYAGALAVWIEFEKYLASYTHFDNSTRIGEALLNQMNCHIHLLKLDEARECVSHCESIFKKGSNNWFVFMEVNFLLNMHSGYYPQARNIYFEVVSHSRFLSLAQQQLERWEVFGGYVSFMEAISQKRENMRDILAKRVGKILANAPTQARDKSGYNLSILVLDVLQYLAAGDYTEVYSRMDALKRYTRRHLTGNEYYRSNIFMRMLFAAEKADFERKATLQRTDALRNELLQATLLPKGKLIDGMEIIPYTVLWDLTVGFMRE